MVGTSDNPIRNAGAGVHFHFTARKGKEFMHDITVGRYQRRNLNSVLSPIY